MTNDEDGAEDRAGRDQSAVGPRASIYDVAREVGVAASTVSRTFSRPGRVSFATAEKVRAAAERLGYRKEALRRAGSADRGPSWVLGLVVADISNPVFIDMVQGVEFAARQSGMTTILSNSREDREREREAIQRSIASVDGLILAGARLPDAAIRTFAKQKAMVVMNRSVRGVASVVIDQAQGARLAVEHLAERGAASVAYLAGPETSWANGMRWAAIRDVARDHGVEARRMGAYEPTMAGGGQAARDWLLHRTDAVIAYNDLMALSFMRQVQEDGVKVPEDVMIVGFDDLLASSLVNPQLSTVVGPFEKMGATAAAHVMAIANGAHAATDRPVTMPARLIVRASSLGTGGG
ncbi:LacI family DNA-binding transcriptional regulator [Kocuria massiliensis]|uniref:LacI family DNA-binding transcriptional regulator n=1 Tax=Kocuria massiliensis TaxID=1926282 RepID=UPI0022B9660C|nr:LacI family DNA-binding transcriptional regulator [Kocuria massiliensis]